MTRQELIADAIRGAYWITTACQGDAYQTWEEMDPERREVWIGLSRRFEQRIERQGYMITKMLSSEDY